MVGSSADTRPLTRDELTVLVAEAGGDLVDLSQAVPPPHPHLESPPLADGPADEAACVPGTAMENAPHPDITPTQVRASYVPPPASPSLLV